MPVAEAGATAQEAYRLMLRQHIAPALRELGFRRVPSATVFRYATAVSQALRSAAAEDENVWVRWAARYALRLAGQETSSG